MYHEEHANPREGLGRYALRCALTALSLALGASPLALLLVYLPGMSVSALVIALSGLLFGFAAALLPGRARLGCAIPGALFSFALGMLGMLRTNLAPCVGLGLLGSAFALSLPLLRDGGLPSTFALVLAVLHAFMPLGARLAGIESLPLFPLACAYLIVFLLNTNAQSLRAQCSSHQQRPAQSMRTGNTLLTIVLFLLCVLVSQFSALREAFETAVQQLLHWIVRFFSALIPDPVDATGGGGGSADLDMSGLGQGETAAIWKILEYVGYAIAFVAVVALCIWLCTRIYKLLRAVAGHIRAFMSRYAQSLKADYVDQTEDLSGWGEIGQTLRDRANSWSARLKPIRWESLDNRARIRAAYTAVLRREKKPDSSRTARETLLSGANTGKSDASQLCQSYERARYSDHPITDAEAENARRAL